MSRFTVDRKDTEYSRDTWGTKQPKAWTALSSSYTLLQ